MERKGKCRSICRWNLPGLCLSHFASMF
jgi:hypothetical protein